MRDGESVVKRLYYLWQSASGRHPGDTKTINRCWDAYLAALELATMPEPHSPKHPCKCCDGSGVRAFHADRTCLLTYSTCTNCHGSGFYCPSCGGTDDDVLARNWARGCCDDGWHCGRDSSLYTFCREMNDTRYKGPWDGCLFCDVWRELRILAFGQQWMTNTHPGDSDDDLDNC